MDVGLVCDACSALTPIGVPQCARCGQPVALDPRPRRTSKPSGPNGGATAAAAEAKAAGTACTKCGTNVPPNFKFCQICGTRVVVAQDFQAETRVGPTNTGTPSVTTPQKAPQARAAQGGALQQQARARLTLIRGDGEDGVTFQLAGTDHL